MYELELDKVDFNWTFLYTGCSGKFIFIDYNMVERAISGLIAAGGQGHIHI